MPVPRQGREIAQVIRDHQAGIWRYLRVLGCEPATADDLTQETFLAVLQRPFVDLGPAAASAYLRKVARNLFLAAQRKTSRVLTDAELSEIEAAWDRWAGRDDGAELLAALQVCLQALTTKARRALDLRFGQDESRAKIAAELSMSEDGAKNLLQRSKVSLRECIERKLSLAQAT